MKFNFRKFKNNNIHYLLVILLSVSTASVFGQSKLSALKTNETMTIDGLATESIWNDATWYAIDQTWIGSQPSASDYAGKFKVVWDNDFLYILTEITDDQLSDDHADPLTNWWDDDCIEIFIDENASKGNHQYNYNAFAYHVSTTYDVVDMGTDQNPHLYNDHITTIMTKNGNVYTWECKVKIFSDSYVYGAANTPLKLAKDKKMGFSMAYNDNDANTTRDNFMGSGVVPGTDKNVGYITADYFQELTLTDANLTAIETENTIENNIKLYPNPSAGLVHISLTQNQFDKLEIYSATGNLILSNSIQNQTDINLNLGNLPAGIYYITFKGEKTETKKLILN